MVTDVSLRMALDYAGVAVFAATGALAAARRGHDILAFAFFAAVTGIGGGTLRDLLLGAPVFWVGDAGYIGICVVAAGLVWAAADRIERLRALLWLDALGLAAYSVVGAAKAAAFGAPPLVSVVMGVLSATFGGIVRDVLVGEPSVLLRRELYITAAVGGAAAFVLLRLAGLPEPLAGLIAAVFAFALRGGALTRGWTLPAYRSPAEPEAPALVAPSPPVIPPVIPPKVPAEVEPPFVEPAFVEPEFVDPAFVEPAAAPLETAPPKPRRRRATTAVAVAAGEETAPPPKPRRRKPAPDGSVG